MVKVDTNKVFEEIQNEIYTALSVPKECLNTKYDSASVIKSRNEEFRNKILKKYRGLNNE